MEADELEGWQFTLDGDSNIGNDLGGARQVLEGLVPRIIQQGVLQDLVPSHGEEFCGIHGIHVLELVENRGTWLRLLLLDHDVARARPVAGIGVERGAQPRLVLVVPQIPQELDVAIRSREVLQRVGRVDRTPIGGEVRQQAPIKKRAGSFLNLTSQ